MSTTHTKGWLVYKRLVSYSLKYWPYLLVALMGLIVGAVTQPLFAKTLQPLLDKAILEHDPVVIRWLPLGILGIFVLRGLATFSSGYYLSLIGRKVTQDMRDQVFTHMLRMPVHFYESTPSGKLLAYVSYYIDQVSNASIRGISSLIQDSATIISLLGLMLMQSWQLTLGMLLIFPFIAVVIVYVTKRMRRISRKIQDSVGDVTQIANESIRAYKVVRIFNGENYESQRFHMANANNMRLEMKRTLTDLVGSPVIQFMVAFALAAMVFIATRPGTLETLSPGTFMSFIMSMVLLLGPIRSLTQLNVQLQTAITAGEGIFELLDSQPEPDHGTLMLDRAKGEVEFKNVSFVYPTAEKTVLKQINLAVKAGEKIALVGKSGSGKTTLVNLLPRFHDPISGQILLDGMNIADIKLYSLRQQMAYVGQDIVLFNDTVRHNIAYGNMRDMSEVQIRAAAEAAYALDFIDKLPNGLDTVIGDNGVMLSGGQRQRLSIARAILANAPILILDEATSALDTESERNIQAALDKLMVNRTTFIIAHRLSTIENADRIIVMHEGEIIETGTHTDLLALGGQYARLHAMQFHDDESKT